MFIPEAPPLTDEERDAMIAIAQAGGDSLFQQLVDRRVRLASITSTPILLDIL